MASSQTCSAHAIAPAAWRCTGCERALCSGCVGLKRLGATELTLCVHCGEVADRILTRREEVRSYFQRLPGALGYPLNPTGLITMLGAGVVMYVLGFAGGWGAAIGTAVTWAYVFSLARASAMGSSDLDPPDFTNFWDFFRPMRRAFFAIFVAWLPAILFLIVLANTPTKERLELEVVGPDVTSGINRLTGDVPVNSDGELVVPEGLDPDSLSPELREQYDELKKATGTAPKLRKYKLNQEEPLALRAVKNPLFWMFLLLGFFLGPMALAIGVADGTYLQMINPKLLVGAIRRFPKSYVLLSGSLVGILFAQGVVKLLSALLSQVPFPIVPGVFGSTLEMYLPLVAARVIGLYLYVHGAELGYLPEQDAFEPALPNALPRGVLPATFAASAAPVPAPTTERGEPIATAGLLGAAATWQPSPRTVELPPAPDDAPPPAAYTRPTEITLDDDEPGSDAAPPEPPPRPRPTELDPTALDGRAFDFLDEPEPPANELAAALSAKEFSRALALYRAATPELAASVGCEGLFEIGRQAATEGDFPAAVRALKSAAQADPSSPFAPKALVVMARVLSERMGDAANASKVYAHVVRTYPGTDAARFAAGRLNPPS